jgi:subtilisin family serine protease
MKQTLTYLLLSLLSHNLYAQERPPLKVAVIDSGLDIGDVRFKNHLCPSGHKDFTGEGIYDRHGHGTHMVGTILLEAGPKASFCLIIIKYFSEKLSSEGRLRSYRSSLRYLRTLQVQIVNISGGGTEEDIIERNTIKKMVNTFFVVAAGNDGKNLDVECYYYPACYTFTDRVVTIGNLNNDGSRASSSNYGKAVDGWEMGQRVFSTAPGGLYREASGTSISASVATGKLIRKIHEKYN